jgi:tetratricopeptide (TPR) repeat protein
MSTTSIEPEVRKLRSLVTQGDYSQALEGAERLAGVAPDNRDVLYLLAVCLRYLGRIPEALVTLERFEGLHPGFGRLFQERGHCLRQTGRAGAAIAAYERGVQLNPTLLASWRALAELYGASGRRADAESAGQQVLVLASLPGPVLSASGTLAEGDVHAAEAQVRRYLQSHPMDVEAMRLLARIGVQLEVLDDAEFLLQSALVFAPDYHLARYEYGVVLSKRHKHAAAREQVRELLRIEPRNRAYRTLNATVCVGLGDHAEALRIFNELAAESPEEPEIHLSIAHALKTLGRGEEAITAYRRSASVRPSFGDAYWSLANLKTYRFADEEVESMRRQEALPSIALVDRYHLCFALGKALEDRAEYAESFRYYAQGNRLRKQVSHYDVRAFEESVEQQIAVGTRDFFQARADWGSQRRDPIFIVGLPRAGSTLIEQVLASHSQVEGTMELADIPRLVQRLQGREAAPRYPAVLRELSAGKLRQLGEQYIADTQVFRAGKAGASHPYFIDKMPNNFRHLGLIQLILPRAKIIDARREAFACCFSNFKQLFAAGQEFTYDLEDIARYYRGYLELMAHWDTVLPGRILRVQYEELVADLEGHVRRLLDYLELEYEPGCLEFYRNERSVRTASSEQVRQPIFTSGLEQWRHFEPWLGVLKGWLGEAGPIRNHAQT